MSILSTYSTSYGATAHSTVKASRPGIWRRLFDRMIEARMRKAEEHIRQHRHLIPRDLEQAGWKLTERSEDSLPFVR